MEIKDYRVGDWFDVFFKGMLGFALAAATWLVLLGIPFFVLIMGLGVLMGLVR